VIPNEAVEAAVEAHCEGTMRAALEAAAERISAAAWSTCAVESARCGLLSAADALLLANRNPYRSQL